MADANCTCCDCGAPLGPKDGTRRCRTCLLDLAAEADEDRHYVERRVRALLATKGGQT